MARIHPRCDVWLVATGAEERLYTGSPDHLGALALARRARAHGAGAACASPCPWTRWAATARSGCARPRRSPAGRRGRGAARRPASARVPVRWVRDEDTGNSDHREFELLGLPGAKLGVGAGGEPCRHTPCDRPSRLDRTSLRLARRLVERPPPRADRLAASTGSLLCKSPGR